MRAVLTVRLLDRLGGAPGGVPARLALHRDRKAPLAGVAEIW